VAVSDCLVTGNIQLRLESLYTIDDLNKGDEWTSIADKLESVLEPVTKLWDVVISAEDSQDDEISSEIEGEINVMTIDDEDKDKEN
jgi:hypothetical protein